MPPRAFARYQRFGGNVNAHLMASIRTARPFCGIRLGANMLPNISGDEGRYRYGDHQACRNEIGLSANHPEQIHAIATAVARENTVPPGRFRPERVDDRRTLRPPQPGHFLIIHRAFRALGSAAFDA